MNTMISQLYPNVLFTVAGDRIIDMGSLQIAFGIFPRRVFVNQPVEAIIILQNMIDQPLQVKLSLNFPTQDAQKNPIVLATPQKVITTQVGAGEVGVLRVPVFAYPPTRPNTDIPVHIAIRYRSARPGRGIRAGAGELDPDTLNISPYKLQALREIEFITWAAGQSTDILTAYFDIAPRRLPPYQDRLEPRYEVIWKPEGLQPSLPEPQPEIAPLPARPAAAQAQLSPQESLEIARRIAINMNDEEIYTTVLSLVPMRFKARGLSLSFSEAKAVAKMIAYTLVEAPMVHDSFIADEFRWFQTLAEVIAYDEMAASGSDAELVERVLFEVAAYDAVLLSFNLLQPFIKEDLGSKAERIAYAEKVALWLANGGDADLTYAYFPLVFGGLLVNHMIGVKQENPWVLLEELRRSSQQRAKTASGELKTILKLLDTQFARAEEELVRSQIRRW
jgi:hypothetical protein